MNAGKHQRRLSCFTLDGHASESLNSTVLSFHDAEALTTTIRKQHQRRDGVHLPMSLERGVQVDVSNDFSVDDDKRLLFEKLARVVERAAGPEYLRLLYVIEFDAKAAAIA